MSSKPIGSWMGTALAPSRLFIISTTRKKSAPDDVHFVNIGNTGNAIFVSLTPNRFRLRFNPTFSTKHSYRPIKYSQRTFHLNGKVHVSWCVNNVYPMSIPLTGSGRRSNCNTSFLFLHHPIHSRSTIMHFTNFVYSSCIKQYPFGSGSLAKRRYVP